MAHAEVEPLRMQEPGMYPDYESAIYCLTLPQNDSRDSTPRPIPALTELLQQAVANPSQEYPSPPPTTERPRANDSPTTPRQPVGTPQMWRMRSVDIPESSSPVQAGSSPGPSRFYDAAGPSNAILYDSPVCSVSIGYLPCLAYVLC